MSAMISERRSYVAGPWVEGDEALPVENPADESHVAELSVTPVAEFRPGDRRRPPAFDEGPWPSMTAAGAGPGRARVPRPRRGQRRPLVATMVAEAGQPTTFAEAMQLRSGVALARTTIDLYLLDDARGDQPGSGRRAGTRTGRVERPPSRARRRRHRDHAVQRRDPHGVPEDRPRADGRQLGDPAAEPAHSRSRRSSSAPPPTPPELPPGVLSVVVESGRRRRRAAHHRPRRSTWCRSPVPPPWARRILAQAASTVKRVALELGGKSAQIYLPDAVERAGDRGDDGGGDDRGPGVRRRDAHGRAARPQGRSARGGERRRTPSLNVGAPTDPASMMGPSSAPRSVTAASASSALAEENGGKVASGGGRPAGFDTRLLLRADGARPARQREPGGAGGDLRSR